MGDGVITSLTTGSPCANTLADKIQGRIPPSPVSSSSTVYKDATLYQGKLSNNQESNCVGSSLVQLHGRLTPRAMGSQATHVQVTSAPHVGLEGVDSLVLSPPPSRVCGAPHRSVWRGWECHRWRAPRSGIKRSGVSAHTAVDLCAGCGGLALAAHQLGYTHSVLVDSNPRCVDTLRANGFTTAVCAELADTNWTPFKGATLVTAGLPCQPWSEGGVSKGEADSRNLWHEAVRAIRDIEPTIFLLEMVTGFLADKHRTFRNSLLDQLSGLGFMVEIVKTNASQHGLPQDRRRCLILGHRGHGMVGAPPDLPAPSLRQGLASLGPPNGINRHQVHGLAREYRGHRPSTWDGLAHTIRAGNGSPGGGNNTIRLDDGTIRYFTVRELARVQGFPDEHSFDPVWSRAIMEIGNACPPILARRWLHQLQLKAGSAAVPEPRVEPAAQEAEVLFTVGSDEETASEDPDHSIWPQETTIREARTVAVDTALGRRLSLIGVLQAQAHILQRDLSLLVRDVASMGKDRLEALVTRIEGDSRWVDELRSSEIKDAAINAIKSVRPTESPISGKRQPVRQAAETALELAKVISELRRTQQLSISDEDTGSVGSAARDAYLHMLDTEKVPVPEDAICRVWNVEADCQEDPKSLPRGRRVYFKIPRRLMTSESGAPAEDEVTSSSSTPFFTKPKIMLAESENGIKYQSLKATLTLEDHTGQQTQVDSIVDSGAAWCAIRLSLLEQRLPDLVTAIESSTMRFHDASGATMSLVGRVPLKVWIGDQLISTTTYVFRDLGAPFLLGANALLGNGCMIDCNASRLYVAGDPKEGVPMRSATCVGCDLARDATATTPKWRHRLSCPHSGSRERRVICDQDNRCLQIRDAEDDTVIAQVQCEESTDRLHSPTAQLVLESEVTIPPGATMTLAPRLEGVVMGSLAPVKLEVNPILQLMGLECNDAIHNPTNAIAPVIIRNTTARAVVAKAGLVMYTAAKYEEEDSVLVAAVLDEGQADWDTPSPPDIDHGGIDFLKARGLSLDSAIDPEQRLEDGSYAPLSEAKKRTLYEIALRWHQVWAADAKVPKVSYLVVIDIPTGNAAPIAQTPYPIAAKLRSAAMEEINKLLKAGLIEPSISDWASPALIIAKKDSTVDNIKIKFAIDYRRVNSVTEADAGGLGTQADILYGVGGKFKFLGLCDAAGGFYQFLLSPSSRGKSAFILPASMGGTLFQWRVAPYGLTRNPAGYSRGMQWVLKGLHDLRDLGDGAGKGGATSWLDDICMRATDFESFAELFELVLSRLAMAGMSLKGSKCELLHAAVDILGYVATPHGLMLQKPKLKGLMDNGIPTTPKAAMTFLGAVAFLRRVVPRISLLAAPMTAAIKSFEKRHAPARGPPGKDARTKTQPHVRKIPKDGPFSPSEQEEVNQSWHAIMDHMDGDVVLAAPDFEDPLAHFVICTDASDYAVGGVLMQWQHEASRGPGPPAGVDPRSAGKDSLGRDVDPLDNKWRLEAGWKLKIIGYYSKTLDSAQKHYPPFDKEAGAALLCCRHWADLITYHPTTLYTDSAVATSMLTKHIAPPRLQRWGAELASFLPHLRISYRKGCDNGLADLLSRYPAFRNYAAPREEIVSLPDDYFDYIGEAPLYCRLPCTRERSYLSSAKYQLLEPKVRPLPPDAFWTESQETGDCGKRPAVMGDGSLGLLALHAMNAVTESSGEFLPTLMTLLKDRVAEVTARQEAGESVSTPFEIFRGTYGTPPLFEIETDNDEVYSYVRSCIDESGGRLVQGGEHPDVVLRDRLHHCDAPSDAPIANRVVVNFVRAGSTPLPSLYLAGMTCNFDISGVPVEELVGTSSNHVSLSQLLSRSVAQLLSLKHGVPLHRDGSMDALLHADWSTGGYGSSVQRIDSLPEPPELGFSSVFGIDEDESSPRPVRRYDWQTPTPEDEDVNVPPTVHPTVKITLEMQRHDPRLAPLIEHLEGTRRASRPARLRTADKYELRDDGLHRIVVKDGEPGLALVVPRQARSALLARYHYSLADGGGHAGGQTMYDQLRVDYYWPEMERECHDFVAACHICGSTRSQGTIDAEPRASPTPSAPFQVIHVDHKGPLPLSGGYAHVLVVVCALTKYTLYIPVADTTGASTLRALQDRVFAYFGYPLVIISDNGSAFANKLMKASEALYGYRQVFVMPHTPQANGLAEAAVKKIKLIFDRHTTDYQGWHLLCGMAQTAINCRVSSGTMESPFVALFGRQPVTLTALENPSLLPTTSPETKSIKDLAHFISRLQRRLQDEADAIKSVQVLNSNQHQRGRSVRVGDKVWLNYSDSERQRYLRKHGHGIAWRHAFEVAEVKPHAVRLIVPKDGSVPEVLPWQSLRKCAFAAPCFQRDDLLVPDVNGSSVPIVPPLTELQSPSGDRCELHDSATPSAPIAETEESEAARTYDIERIVRAERLGKNRWRVWVKWQGFDDSQITPEPLSNIRKTVTDPDILKQISDCQEEYLKAHPGEREVDDAVPNDEPLPQPTRIQPIRDRERTSRLMYQLQAHNEDDHWLVNPGLRSLRQDLARRNDAMSVMSIDFTDYAHYGD